MPLELTKEQAERQIQELKDHVTALEKKERDECIVRGGDIVTVSGDDYIVAKLRSAHETKREVGLIALKDGNLWTRPVEGDYSLGVLLKEVAGGSHAVIKSQGSWSKRS